MEILSSNEFNLKPKYVFKIPTFHVSEFLCISADLIVFNPCVGCVIVTC